MFQYYKSTKKEADIDIIMLTYNHDKYIAQAIDSVLNQKTNFKYRIIIGEDVSTDKTREIVWQYYKKYPDRIELVLWKRNVGGNRNIIQLSKLCTAKYVTILEADDYWTDPLKLEKQISFLEKHKEYIGTAHNVCCVDENGKLLHRDYSAYPICEEHVYGKLQALNYELIAQTASMIYRNFWKTWDKNQYDAYEMCRMNGDMKICIYLGMQGKIYYFRDIMADHRRVFTGDSWTAKNYDKNLLEFTYSGYCAIKKYIQKVDKQTYEFPDARKFFIEEALIKLFCRFNRENLEVFLKLLLNG